MAEAPIPNPLPATAVNAPANALYGETISTLRYQYNTTIGHENSEENAESGNVLYGQGQITAREPAAYRGQEHKLNAGGILNSGIAGREFGETARKFAAEHYKLTHTEQENQRKRGEREQGEYGKLGLGEANAKKKAEAEGVANTLKEEPVTPPQLPEVVSSKQQLVKPGEPEVVGSRPQPKSASAKVSQRRAAAKKALTGGTSYGG